MLSEYDLIKNQNRSLIRENMKFEIRISEAKKELLLIREEREQSIQGLSLLRFVLIVYTIWIVYLNYIRAQLQEQVLWRACGVFMMYDRSQQFRIALAKHCASFPIVKATKGQIVPVNDLKTSSIVAIVSINSKCVWCHDRFSKLTQCGKECLQNSDADVAAFEYNSIA
jgi:hypothetical protein